MYGNITYSSLRDVKVPVVPVPFRWRSVRASPTHIYAILNDQGPTIMCMRRQTRNFVVFKGLDFSIPYIDVLAHEVVHNTLYVLAPDTIYWISYDKDCVYEDSGYIAVDTSSYPGSKFRLESNTIDTLFLRLDGRTNWFQEIDVINKRALEKTFIPHEFRHIDYMYVDDTRTVFVVISGRTILVYENMLTVTRNI